MWSITTGSVLTWVNTIANLSRTKSELQWTQVWFPNRNLHSRRESTKLRLQCASDPHSVRTRHCSPLKNVCPHFLTQTPLTRFMISCHRPQQQNHRSVRLSLHSFFRWANPESKCVTRETAQSEQTNPENTADVINSVDTSWCWSRAARVSLPTSSPNQISQQTLVWFDTASFNSLIQQNYTCIYTHVSCMPAYTLTSVSRSNIRREYNTGHVPIDNLHTIFCRETETFKAVNLC